MDMNVGAAVGGCIDDFVEVGFMGTVLSAKKLGKTKARGGKTLKKQPKKGSLLQLQLSVGSTTAQQLPGPL